MDRMTEAKAAEKLLRETFGTRSGSYGVAIEDGRTYFSGLLFCVELYSPIDSLPKCSDPEGWIWVIKNIFKSSAAAPEIRELDADEIKAECAWHQTLEKTGLLFINGGEPISLCRIGVGFGINGKYFELISELFPKARISYKGRAGVVFEAENGRAVLSSIRM